MKIVHVVEPLAGGMVTFLKTLVDNLPEDFHIIIHGEREAVTPFVTVRKQFSDQNVKFVRWHSAQRSLNIVKDFNAFTELYSIIKRLKSNKSVDIIHLHCSKGGFIGRLVCRLLGLQNAVIYTPNGAPFMVGSNWASNLLYKKLELIGSLFGGQVVCCSPSEKTSYQLAGIKAITINNGIEYDKIARSQSQRKNNKIFRIITSGRIVDQKNPLLFNNIAQYFEDFKQFEFVWIGDGTDRELLTAKNIKITGWLPKDKVNDRITRADVYLSTANFEGLPFAVLEALALKKPVLLTDCIGNKDLVISGLNGDVFNNDHEAINKILHFYNNRSMLSIMGEHSGLHCKNLFNSKDTYQSYRRLYQKLAYKGLDVNVGLNELAWNKMKVVR